jgi:hypothetical protein
VRKKKSETRKKKRIKNRKEKKNRKEIDEKGEKEAGVVGDLKGRRGRSSRKRHKFF